MSNGMIYNLYVGSDQQTRNHLAEVCPGLFMPFPSLKMGPGDSARSHAADEYICVSEIEGAIDLYLRLLS